MRATFHTLSGLRYQLRRHLGLAVCRLGKLGESVFMNGVSIASWTTLSLIIAVPSSVSRAQCTGVCGDVNSSGSIQSVDLIALFSYVCSADSTGMDMGCSNVDNHAGVTLRDLLFLNWHIYIVGWPINCANDSGPFVPTSNPGYLLHYNSVYPAGDTSVTLHIDGTFAGVTQAAGLVLKVRVDGEVPTFAEVGPTAVSGGASNWEAVAFNGPGTGNVPAGYLMGAFWSADGGSPGPGRHLLGRARVVMPASAQPRTITLEPVEFPIGANQTVVHESPDWDTDVWSFNLDPWIIDLTGDVNNNRVLTSSDVIGLVNYVFKSGPAPYPFAASGDVNCTGAVNSADIITLVNYVFKSGPTPCDIATECTLALDGWTCP